MVTIIAIIAGMMIGSWLVLAAEGVCDPTILPGSRREPSFPITDSLMVASVGVSCPIVSDAATKETALVIGVEGAFMDGMPVDMPDSGATRDGDVVTECLGRDVSG
jgi:hypothetical protein